MRVKSLLYFFQPSSIIYKLFHEIIIFVVVRGPVRARTRSYEHESPPFALTTSIVTPSCVRLLGSLLAAIEGGNEECFCGRDLHWRGQGRRHNGRPNEMRFIKTEVHSSRWGANTDQQSYVGLYWRHCQLIEFVICLTTLSVLQAMSVERLVSDELQNIYGGLISRHYLAFDYSSCSLVLSVCGTPCD